MTFYSQQKNRITRALYPQCSNPERVIGGVTLDGVNIDRVAIDSKIAVTRWCGEKVDYGDGRPVEPGRRLHPLSNGR